MAEFKAIIWDCDGVLMDSEHLACSLSARILSDAGFPISTDDYVRRFCGQSHKHIHDTIAAEADFDIWSKIDKAKKLEERNALFARELRAIDGIADVLNALDLPIAIASGSDYNRLHYTLDLVNLRDHFGEHVYSSVDVAHGKPAPDIFLYAAEKLNVNPTDCLVIEDSINGVKAGVAAGMTVYGFTGGTHVQDKHAHRQELLALGAQQVFDHMNELLPALKNTKL